MQLFLTQIQYWQETFSGEPRLNYALCALLILLSWIFRKMITSILLRITHRILHKWLNNEYSDEFVALLKNPISYLFQIGVLYVALNFIEQPLQAVLFERIENHHILFHIRIIDLIDHLFLLGIIYFHTVLALRIADFIYHIRIEKANQEAASNLLQLLPMMKEIIKILIWTISFFFILGLIFHVNVPALITGLGIGGVAIALAAKESIENLFASFIILVDKPFQIGDHIKMEKMEGVVEKIGFRSTHLRLLNDHLGVVPNKKLIDEHLENLSVKELHKVLQQIYLEPTLDKEQIISCVQQLNNLLQKNTVIENGGMAYFKGFHDNKLHIQIQYAFKNNQDKNSIHQLKEQLNLAIYAIIRTTVSNQATTTSLQ
jgi:MscS family membrane protein